MVLCVRHWSEAAKYLYLAKLLAKFGAYAHIIYMYGRVFWPYLRIV